MYSFDEGKRFEPDYILILGNETTVIEQQHIFIEPKGQHLRENDAWKEKFLLQLENDSRCIAHPDYDNYSVKGLPFYTLSLTGMVALKVRTDGSKYAGIFRH